MKLEDVTARVAKVERWSWDDAEAAHSAEDRLWEDVLDAIADGKAEQPRAMAREALKTLRIVFRR